MDRLKLFHIAFRNTWRHPRRTLLTGLVITMGVASLIVGNGFTNGILQTMVRQATEIFLGHFKIYHQDFPDELKGEATLPARKKVLEILNNDSAIAAYSPRIQAQAMISSGANMAAITLVGVDPQRELGVSKLKEALIEGQYLDSQDPFSLLIGIELAELLEVQIGDRIVITTSSVDEGEIRQELFRLSGLVQFQQPGLDKAMAFIGLKRSQELLGLGHEVHEIIVKFNNLEQATGEAGSRLSQRLTALHPSIRAKNWRQEQASLASILEMSQFSLLIIGFILFLMISLSVMNSLFMSIYERFFEYGVMQALGTRPWAIFLLIIYESMIIASLGCLFGAFMGAVINFILMHTGVDYGNFEMMGMRFYEPIRTSFSWTDIVIMPVTIWFLTVIISIYPAVNAARITPLQAMSKK